MDYHDYALTLLEKGIDKNHSTKHPPVMVHGTRLDAVIHLFKTGQMHKPSFLSYATNHPCSRGYLFFIPRKRSFVGHPIYDTITLDISGKELDNEAMSYANAIQVREYLEKSFGFCPYHELLENENFVLTQDLRTLAKEGYIYIARKIHKTGLNKVSKEMKKQRGLVLGINKKILKTDIKPGHDRPYEEVMLICPKDFIFYVDYVICSTTEQRNTLIDLLK